MMTLGSSTNYRAPTRIKRSSEKLPNPKASWLASRSQAKMTWSSHFVRHPSRTAERRASSREVFNLSAAKLRIGALNDQICLVEVRYYLTPLEPRVKRE